MTTFSSSPLALSPVERRALQLERVRSHVERRELRQRSELRRNRRLARSTKRAGSWLAVPARY